MNENIKTKKNLLQGSEVPKEVIKAKKNEEKISDSSGSDLLKNEISEIKIRKAKGSKNITSGICKILATFNNTKVCFTDLKGNVISWSSAGKCNFKGSRKSTAYAAQIVTQDAGRIALSHGMKEVFIKVEGPGMGRDSSIRTVQAIGLIINGIIDVTPIPHNGCRAKNPRSV
jgi:small subunit ribosomal protein S11